jgi:prevent-host-death family protein
VKIAPVADVKAHFSRYVDEAQEGPIIVTRNGRPVAVLAAVPDPDELERFVLAHTPRFRRLLAEAERRIQATGGLTHEEVWRPAAASPARPEAPGTPEQEP